MPSKRVVYECKYGGKVEQLVEVSEKVEQLVEV